MYLRILLLALLGLSITDTAAAEPDKRVARALKKAGVQYTIDADGDFQVQVDTGKGRSQRVWISSQADRFEDVEVRDVFSYGVVLDDSVDEGFSGEFHRRLLSSHFKIGAWVIQSDRAACFTASIEATANPRMLRAALRAVAQTADQLEAEITPDVDRL